MIDFKKIIEDFKNCPCGEKHECSIKDIRIGSGIVKDVGNILKENGFDKELLLVADKDTLKASDGILESLKDFNLKTYVYDYLRVSKMSDVRFIESLIDKGAKGVIAVGSGSVHDTCRLACANKDTPLCLFATAPSMDGFASYSAPIVDGNFKLTYPAKSPEVIIGDTKILAKAPTHLKSAGFGDMVSKYIAIIDWRVSHLILGESFCEKVCGLTRFATDEIMKLADGVTKDDEKTAGVIFETLLLTGIAMSFTKTSRPASGTEHIQAHYWECMELLAGKDITFHGVDVGISTLIISKYYGELAKLKKVKCKKEETDWEAVYKAYGELKEDVIKLNTPDTITDGINPKKIEDNWDKIVEIINSVPNYDEIKSKMLTAGCLTDYKERDLDEKILNDGFIYHPYMRRRLSLKRLSNMIDFEKSE